MLQYRHFKHQFLQVNLVNFKLPLGLTVKRARSSQEKVEEESEAKRVKIQNDGQELVVNCDIGRPRCLLCRLTELFIRSLPRTGPWVYFTHWKYVFSQKIAFQVEHVQS